MTDNYTVEQSVAIALIRAESPVTHPAAVASHTLLVTRLVGALYRQVEFADVVLLNKIETLSGERAGLLKEVVQTLSPWAVLVPTTHSQVNSLNIIHKEFVTLSDLVDHIYNHRITYIVSSC
jgi:G3E family GTPase